jgi:hypothetical protein
MTIQYTPQYVNKHKTIDKVKQITVNTKVDRRNINQVERFFLSPCSWDLDDYICLK